MKLPWTSGSRSFDEDLGLDVLEIARENPHTEKDLRNNLELRGAVYAILESLPRNIRKKIKYEHKVDIASVIVLQRAAATEVALTHPEAVLEPQEAFDEHAVYDSADTSRAEEA